MLKCAPPSNLSAGCGAISLFLARHAGPLWRRHAVDLTRAGSAAAVICLIAFLSVAGTAAEGAVESDAAKMFLVGCLKLIALARLYEACCRASRLGGNRWLGPAAVMTVACCPLACLRFTQLWTVRSESSHALCRPTELAAYYVLLLDLNCLFRAAAAASAYGDGRLDKVIAGPVMSMAAGYAFKGASFFIGGRVAANLSPELRQVCYTMTLVLATCACLHLILLPGYLVRLAHSGCRASVPALSADSACYYQYYGSRKQEIKAVMVAGVLLLQSLGGGAAGENVLGRLCAWLASPAWDLCLALPYCVYLCVQFAVCEQAQHLLPFDSGENNGASASTGENNGASASTGGNNGASASTGENNDASLDVGTSTGDAVSRSSISVYTQTEPVWRKRVLSETSSSGFAASPTHTQPVELRHHHLRQQLSVPGQPTRQQQQQQRSLDDSLQLLRRDGGSAAGCLSNAEFLSLMRAGHVKPRQLECLTGCPNRAVELRRQNLAGSLGPSGSVGLAGTVLSHIPYQEYDWKQVTGRCCEEVIGLATLPLGLAGPLLVNGVEHRLPLATTEGCLVASVNRGCAVVRAAGGCQASVYRDGMTRAPVLAFPSAVQAVRCLQFAESEAGQKLAASAFEATSGHCRLRSLTCLLAGRRLHLRYCAETGDAMGMNMLSKAAEAAVSSLLSRFPEARLISLSGNACSDKKPTAVNWILGRGKSVVCEARLPASLVRSTLRASPANLVALNQAKNLEGSALAGAVGGFNAHAANLAAAVFIACGQDPAQVVEASQAITCLELLDNDELYASVTMPSLEVGVVGGGTHLPTQRACLRLVGLPEDQPAACLAQVVCAGVLCAEISLLAALANQELVASHMKLNRSKQMHHAPS